MSETQRQPELGKEDLKNMVNQALAELGSGMKFKKVKESVPGCENLLGKRIVMVDDVKDVLEGFVADLMVASGGNASFILHKEQLLEELVGEILARNPDVVLIDGHLAGGIKGDALAESLGQNNANVKSVIFSSDSNIKSELKSQHIAGVVKKETSAPEDSIKAVAEVLK